ncbi:MAG: hypothetical protein U0L85_10455 [Bacilli bacterium]|nr:hypothetical protein [Bacilli bacterium]
MAKKVNEIKDGDLKSNIVVLRSVFGKVGQKYFIQPQRNSRGRYADCVKRVDAHGDIILTPAELEKESRGEAAYIKEDEVFVIEDGKTFNLDDIYEAAIWEAIKDCSLIAPDRFAKNDKGEYLIDGTTDPKSKRPRYGTAELYIDRPGYESQRRVTRRKLIVEASNYIMNDERGYEGRLLVAKVLGRDMKNLPNADVEDYLLSIAEKTPEKIINCYTGGDIQLRMLFIEAKEKGVIYKKNGLYLFGEEGQVTLGATDNAVVEWMKSAKNQKTLSLIRKDTYPEMFED